ncbi:hypothetical protein JAAARDRAFT_427500 [Jaapia argillacea MUCL 33604]|uniref:Uncharacterized protein n=1 Tax=Jaapia argillacea MUCL 33604 TaxID=933084 RepID=A0A067PT61_9AGAM|nr:hypothetical protein JAAARDRAFT_427500 [Jaapia argillacea MUCL 33604]
MSPPSSPNANEITPHCSKEHVADGLRAMHRAYSCPDLAPLKSRPEKTIVGNICITTRPMRY